jgi:hypothetical protein
VSAVSAADWMFKVHMCKLPVAWLRQRLAGRSSGALQPHPDMYTLLTVQYYARVAVRFFFWFNPISFAFAMQPPRDWGAVTEQVNMMI